MEREAAVRAAVEEVREAGDAGREAAVRAETACRVRAAADGAVVFGWESVGWQNFGKMLLVFGCIGTDLCKKIRVLQHFPKSTGLSS